MTRKEDAKPLLLTLDGSDRAFQTVHYISKIHSLKDRPIVLFTVFSKIPDAHWDLEKEPAYNRKLGEIRAWETHRAKKLETYMGKARQILLNAGFPPDAVEIRLHERRKGVARDIIREVRKGYFALVVGRKGVGRMRRILVGSVANKLLERVATIPVVLIGRDVQPGKVLIALDGSAGSLKAVDCVGEVFGASGYEINLTNVMRYEAKDRIAESERFIGEVFDRAIDRLTAAGIARKHISTQIVTGAPSRAEAIVKEAKQGGFGTIVMGKRGLSEVRDFSMGSVTQKVVQSATGRAVWVVS
jgi:nucleotide-binding universal stress UspA family protein